MPNGRKNLWNKKNGNERGSRCFPLFLIWGKISSLKLSLKLAILFTIMRNGNCSEATEQIGNDIVDAFMLDQDKIKEIYQGKMKA